MAGGLVAAIVGAFVKAKMRAETSGQPASFTLFALDEMPTTAIPRLDEYLSIMGGFGATALLYMQSLAQLDEVYGDDRARTILANCHQQVYYPPRDVPTAEYVSKLFGTELQFVEFDQSLALDRAWAELRAHANDDQLSGAGAAGAGPGAAGRLAREHGGDLCARRQAIPHPGAAPGWPRHVCALAPAATDPPPAARRARHGGEPAAGGGDGQRRVAERAPWVGHGGIHPHRSGARGHAGRCGAAHERVTHAAHRRGGGPSPRDRPTGPAPRSGTRRPHRTRRMTRRRWRTLSSKPAARSGTVAPAQWWRGRSRPHVLGASVPAPASATLRRSGVAHRGSASGPMWTVRWRASWAAGYVRTRGGGGSTWRMTRSSRPAARTTCSTCSPHRVGVHDEHIAGARVAHDGRQQHRPGQIGQDIG